MTHLTASVQGIGVLGPALSDWPHMCSVLRGEAPFRPATTVLPPPAILPPAERRRAGRTIKLALAIGAEAVAHAQVDASLLPTVFSSAGGDGENCHEICSALASSDRQISPTRFHNSVHNAAAGYWTIAHGCTEPSTSLCANDASFGAGLVEAASQLASGQPSVLLIAYDVDYPAPLGKCRPIPDAFGVALVLTASSSQRSLARIALQLCDSEPSVIAEPQLEQLRRTIPAARSLPLLECIARQESATVVLDYLAGTRVAVAIFPHA
ncbi:MAG TPA: beta-ketoacyl synthase chain length factor [Steroidobacteraceae bacterium]|nr:beta-ketoacyl synthase chain length factor [Steroidobacteraceae bacterium]